MSNVVTEKVNKGFRIAKVFTSIWAYITTILFAYNGYGLFKSGATSAAYVIWGLALTYIIFVTISLYLGTRKTKTKEQKQDYKGINFVIKVFKLFIAVASVVLLTSAFDLSTRFKVLNILWLLFTIGLEVWFFIVKTAIKSVYKVAKNAVTKNKEN